METTSLKQLLKVIFYRFLKCKSASRHIFQDKCDFSKQCTTLSNISSMSGVMCWMMRREACVGNLEQNEVGRKYK